MKKKLQKLAKPWIQSLQCYEPGLPIEEVARQIGFKNVEEIVKLASNENPLGPSPLAIKAMQKAVYQMHRYPDGGAFYLKLALASKLNLKTAQILLANGSNEIVNLLAHVFLDHGTNIVTADRAFLMYKIVASNYNAKTIQVPMKNFTYDLNAILSAITPRTRLIFIDNPNNPTGTMVGEKEISNFMKHVPAHVIVCFDEAYIELLPPEKQLDTLKYVRQNKNVVILRTFSKSYGLAGLRIGYAISSEECIALLNRVRQPFNVNAMALAAAEVALKDEKFIKKTVRIIQNGRAYFEREFSRLGLKYVPSVTNFILVNIVDHAYSPFKTGREAFQTLLRKGVILRPMDAYKLPDYVRITVGTPSENKKCIMALEECLQRR